jgi:N-acetylglutamate synthase-like GNAT family acetyltransferase
VDVVIGRAHPDELSAVLALLAEASLPAEGVAEHFDDFLVARAEGKVVGSVGIERYGPSALLRSLAVAPAHRGRGLGRALTERALDGARLRGVRRVFLLTTTAADFFAGSGFKRIPGEEADSAVRASVEFRTACCASAVCMRLDF